jgi:hypothetical protein
LDRHPLPVQNYRATLKLAPMTDGAGAFAEWWTTFGCTSERHDEWTALYRDSFSRWLGSLRRYLESRHFVSQ